MKTTLLIALLWCGIASAQTKAPTPPSVTLTQDQTMAVIARVDSVREAIYRSNATQQERTYSADMLKGLMTYLIAEFNKQNPPKKEEVKTEGKK